MKKISVILAALAVAFAVSCNKEAVNTEVPDTSAPAGMKQVTITASIENADTKTSYDAAGKFSWTKGDKISVLASDGKLYTFTTQDSQPQATFSGYLPDGCSLGDYALYPAEAEHVYNVDDYYPINFMIPSYKDLTKSVSADLPLHGTKGDTGAFSFQHMTGGFKFTIENFDDRFTSAEVSLANKDLKISGVFQGRKSSTHGGYVTYAATTGDDDSKYARKVNVVDNKVELYFPYSPGNDLWGTTTITIVGYDNEGNPALLLNKDVNLGGKQHVRATVIPVAPLKLPTLSNLKNIDWAADNVATFVQEDWMFTSYAQYTDIKELNAVADEDFVYVRITPTKDVKEIRFFFADHGTNKSGDLWMWENTLYGTFYKSARATVTDNKFNLVYNEVDVELITELDGDNVIWKMAFPREAGSWTSSAGSVYLGIMTYGDGFEAPIPKIWGEMLEVTLP